MVISREAEAVIVLSYDLYKKGVDIDVLIYELDDRDINYREVLNSKHLNDLQKIEFLKLFPE